ncbi:FAD-binding protein [Sporolactobacillus vineae]|uniref:FAD-binding protein n=1 Tax=Sporolactobacillus vineae TaxID=444463 RepID=UPI00028895E9|nr:FAD-binding protein [Sporolactobacillus vineae]
MYDVVVIGQGLSGMLAAIWARGEGKRTAMIMSGAGKIMQSTGVLDLIPGSRGTLDEWMKQYPFHSENKADVLQAVAKFKALTRELGYPYNGDVREPVPVVTGSGHIKETALYPDTVTPVPDRGHAVVVGFQELPDFQPLFISKNLQKERPLMTVDAIRIPLGEDSQRVLTQLDAARLLDQKEVRARCLRRISGQLADKGISQADFFVFPSSLGNEAWAQTLKQFSEGLGARVTEAPGMPPNATAIRLNDRLKLKAIRSGVRLYADTTVTGADIEKNHIRSVRVRMANRATDVAGRQFVLATGGILGGGLEVTPDGIRETALHLNTDGDGRPMNPPDNLFLAGASGGRQLTRHGIVGGVYSLVSSYASVFGLRKTVAGGMAK